MTINWDLVLYLYGLGAVITFIAYTVYSYKTETEFSINTFQLFGILILIIVLWWLEVICQISKILYKWLSKPVIKKRKAT